MRLQKSVKHARVFLIVAGTGIGTDARSLIAEYTKPMVAIGSVP
jgi:hypothetical protein